MQIKKITNQNQIARHKLAEKINELVDVVNELQTTLNNYTTRFKELDNECMKRIENGFKNLHTEPADPYAEQRKWIGKLCLFYDDNYRNIKHYGILTRIDECATILKYESTLGNWYCACEPVKPDDDIIYKGER